MGKQIMSLIMEPDYGTPASKRSEKVSVEIDGKIVEVPADTSIMRAAAEVGIDIPKLCATDRLKAFGSCRLCVVEIDGRKGTPSSCTTPVADGMKIATNSEKLNRLRQGVMELYLSDHPENCEVGAACQVHGMAERVGLKSVRYEAKKTHLDIPKDESNPYFNLRSAQRWDIACDLIGHSNNRQQLQISSFTMMN